MSILTARRHEIRIFSGIGSVSLMIARRSFTFAGQPVDTRARGLRARKREPHHTRALVRT